MGIELISFEPKPSAKLLWKLAGPCAASATVRSLPESLPTVSVYSKVERGVPRSDGRRAFRLSLAGASVPTLSVSGRLACCIGPFAVRVTVCAPIGASFGTSTRSWTVTSWLMPTITAPTGWPPPSRSIFQPAGTPLAVTSMMAPIEEPDLRMPSRYSSKNFAALASGQKNGLRSTSAQSQLVRLILWGPIWISAPRIETAGMILRATAPAATRAAVSRAEERPPPL